MAHAENRLPFPGGDSNMTKISICQCLFYQLLTSQRPFRTPLLPTPLCHPEHRGETWTRPTSLSCSTGSAPKPNAAASNRSSPSPPPSANDEPGYSRQFDSKSTMPGTKD